MHKILILTAAFGEGHNTAARNIRDALDFVSSGVRVQVLDLFQSSYGCFYSIAKSTHLGVVRYAPHVWKTIYALLDKSSLPHCAWGVLSKLARHLAVILDEAQPDCVVSTYPLYGHLIRLIYQDHDRPFRFVTVVTDSITVHSAWYRAGSDLFFVPNEATAEVLSAAGIASHQIKPLGFPVSYTFTEPPGTLPSAPADGEPKNLLYIINSGKKKAGRSVDQILELPDVHLTITVGRDAVLKAKLIKRTLRHADRCRILGWTNQMPQLMMRHHLVIGKAGGAVVQECIGARTPMIINQVIPGQEEGNAQLIANYRLGAVAKSDDDVLECVDQAFARNSKRWLEWRENLIRISKPDAALRIAEAILSEANAVPPTCISAVQRSRYVESQNPVHGASGGEFKMLLCDFHIHSNYSDGKLTVPEIIDFYGQRGFDCICLTDHLADPRRLVGRLTELSRLTLAPHQIGEYFEVIERERRRAWRKYSMLVLAGIEFNKDGYTKKTSAHLLGIGLRDPINPALDLTETISRIREQGGLSVASHPHIMKSEWGKNTLYLWHHRDTYAPLLDAWEIANRNNIFTPIGLMNLPLIANSDFHKPKHIYSWKTLLHCEKDPEAIKQCVRSNEQVAITLYRDREPSTAARHPFAERRPKCYPISWQEDLPLKLANQ